MPTLEELKRQRAKVNKAIDQIEQTETEKKLRPLVGKCFIYENSYGVADGCRKWPLYVCVTEFKDGYLYGWQFQRSTRDIIDIQLNHMLWRLDDGDGFTEISRAKFNAAYRTILKTLTEQLAD